METNETSNNGATENTQVLVDIKNPEISTAARGNVEEKYREEFIPYFARRRMSMEPLGHLKNLVGYGSKGVLAKHEVNQIVTEIKTLLEEKDMESAADILGQLSFNLGLVVNGKIRPESAKKDLERLYGIDNVRFTIRQLLMFGVAYQRVYNIFDGLIMPSRGVRVMEVFNEELPYSHLVARCLQVKKLSDSDIADEHIQTALLDIYKNIHGFGPSLHCDINVFDKDTLLKVAPIAILDPSIASHKYYGKGIKELNELLVASGHPVEFVTSKIEFDDAQYMPDSIDKCEVGEYALITKESYEFRQRMIASEGESKDVASALAAWENASRDGELNEMVNTLSLLVTTESFNGLTPTPKEQISRQCRILTAVEKLPVDKLPLAMPYITPILANVEFDLAQVRTEIAEVWFRYAMVLSKVMPAAVKTVVGLLYNSKEVYFTDEMLDKLLGVYPPNIVANMCKWNVNFAFVKANYGVGKSFMDISEQMLNLVPLEVVPYPSLQHWSARFDQLWELASDDARKAMPFPVRYMKIRKDQFLPYLTEYNYDRYAHTFGLNWVEEHIEIDLYALIDSGSIFDAKINYITRYLDVIMLDDKLREMFIKQLKRIWSSPLHDALSEAFMPAFEDLLITPMVPHDIKQTLVLAIIHRSMDVEKLGAFINSFAAKPNEMSLKIINRATYKILPLLDEKKQEHLKTILSQRSEYLNYVEFGA